MRCEQHGRVLWMVILAAYFTDTTLSLHHKLTKRELQQVFGVEDKEKVPEYHLILTERTTEDGFLRIRFRAWNQTFEAELNPNRKLVSRDIVTVVRDKDNVEESSKGLPYENQCHFLGKVVSHDDAPIAISDCQTLMGTVVLPDHFLVLQTLPSRVQHHQAEKHVVYKREAGLNPLERIIEEHLITQNVVHDDFCDTNYTYCFASFGQEPYFTCEHVTVEEENCRKNSKVTWHYKINSECCHLADLFSLNYTVPPAGQLDSPFIFPQLDPITLEIGLFLDSKLYEHFKREYIQDAEQHLLEFSLALINNVHVLYQQPTLSPNLDIVIVRYELWKTQPSNLATIVHKNGQAQSLLDAFCRHQARVNPGSDLTDNSHWDHAVLLTGYDIYHTTASVAGVAPVARMCDPLFACSLVEGLHLGRSFVLAHEMGHNMGMVHDGVQNQCSRSCCLMSAVNGAGKTRWSECSVREFNAFLMQLDETGQGNCLRDSNSGVHTHNHLTDGRLPGQRFTADQQCAYFWGRDYQVEIPTGRQMDDICRILWCGNKGSTISTAHPALEGSWCGQDKWCIDGKCRAWPYGLSPLEIDGGWSEWSQVDKRCPVQQCHITGSIPIRAQHRDCVNPAPNNGGRECEGSSIRGLLCHSAHSTCKGLSREEFSNKVCSSIKYDPNKPDRQLTGTSFMHDTQPCKVWCHLIDSELIRNKGSFPDGSPCGNGLYCIGGSCLALSCRDSALVESEEDCPENKNAHWLEWSSWSHCSRSCGKGGTQRRWRKCSSTNKDVHCLGSAEDYRTCINQPPPCDQVSQWSPWSPCSKKCGSGIQIRTRECLDVDCIEQLTQKRICSNGDCYSQWTEWTSCSATCGGGTRSRTRTCGIENCDEALEERDLCNRQRCVVETWGDWLPCSVSCGVGFQIRERICDGVLCPGGNKQARTCNEQPCIAASDESAANDEWSEWTTCSETCGEGSQVRTRSCTGHTCPSGFLTERRRCVMGPCPEWSDWSDWSSCPSCQSSLKRTRTRSCSSIHNDATSCEGDSIEEDSCANSCDNTNPNTNDLDEQPVWREWSEWSSCSATCGGGRKTRSKLCLSGPCESPLVLEKQLCNSQDCVGVRDFLWSNWSEWTECSATCGEGNRRRSRRCRAIFSFGCDGDSEQTEQCTVTCNKRRKKETSEPEWSAWSDWSSCSCFTLTETRRRYCQIVDPIAQGFCSGPILEQRKCSPKLCAATNGGWSSWSEWSACSKDCQGTGHQIRNRMCSNPLPSNKGLYCVGYSFDQRACTSNSPCGDKVDGGWSEWMEWSECSSPCNNGHRSRTRYCSNPRPASGGLQCFGSDFELQPCSDKETCRTSAAVAGHWSHWSAWTDCPKKCGLAVQSRQRVCELPKDASPQSNVYCEGLAYITSVCPSTACPQSVDGGWGPWSAWSQCTFNCGTGSTTRVRECVSPAPMNGGLPCFGRSSEEEECPASDDFCSATIANSKLIDVEFIAASQ